MAEAYLTDRGFQHFPYIDLGEDRRLKVYESSAALEAKVWLQVIDDSGAAYAHLTLAQARQLADELIWLADHHRFADVPAADTATQDVTPTTSESATRCPVCEGGCASPECDDPVCQRDWHERCEACSDTGFVPAADTATEDDIERLRAENSRLRGERDEARAIVSCSLCQSRFDVPADTQEKVCTECGYWPVLTHCHSCGTTYRSVREGGPTVTAITGTNSITADVPAADTATEEGDR